MPLPEPITNAVARALIWIGAPRRSRGRRTAPALAPESAPLEISTFVRDDELYQSMRDSFIGAGFDPSGFVRLDDRDDDPYRAIGRIAGQAGHRYAVLCHQDVRANLGPTMADLTARLQELDALDEDWVVAGNAGTTAGGRIVRRVQDPHGGFTEGQLPQSVVTLDENFLVFNVGNRPRTTPGLSGFHLYGTDVCLNALRDGGSAYVIDFAVTHLSDGSGDREGYAVGLRRFLAARNSTSRFTYIFMPQGVVFASRHRLARRIFGSARVIAWITRRRRMKSARTWSALVDH